MAYAVCSKVVVLFLLTFCLVLLPLSESVIVLCFVVRYFMSILIILMGKRKLVVFLSLSSWCLLMVVLLFLAVPWVCLLFVIKVFPDHTHLLFLDREYPLNLLYMNHKTGDLDSWYTSLDSK